MGSQLNLSDEMPNLAKLAIVIGIQLVAYAAVGFGVWCAAFYGVRYCAGLLP